LGVSPRLDELRKRYEENPRRFFAPLANEYRKSGDVDRAVELCEVHLADAPANLSGQIVYGQALFDAGRYHEAKQPFAVAAQLDPENLIALRHLGDIARFLGATGEAAGWYQRVLEADPRNEEIAELLREMTVLHATRPPEPPALPDAPELVSALEVPAPQEPEVSEAPEPGVRRLTGFESTSALPADLAQVSDEDDLPVHEIDLGEADPFGFEPRPSDPRIPIAEEVAAPLPPPDPATAPPTLIDIEAAFSMPEVGTFAESLDQGLASLGVPEEDAALLLPPLEADVDLEELGFSEIPEVAVDPSVDLAAIDEPVDSSLGFEDDAFDIADAFDAPAELPAPVSMASFDDAAEFDSAFEVDPPATVAPPTFATETMAELYLRQGLTAEAIAVYVALLEQRPDDPALLGKLAELRAASASPARLGTDRARAPLAVDFFAALAVRQAVPSAEPVREADTAVATADPAASPSSWLDDLDEPVSFAPVTLDAPAPIDVAPRPAAIDDAARGAVFAAAFAPMRPPAPTPVAVAAPEPVPDPVAEPAPAMPRPSSTIKFDQFFATAAPPMAAEPPPPTPAAAPMPGPTASDEDFQSWLSGLTKS